MRVRCRVSIRPCNAHANGPLGEERDAEVDSIDLLTRTQLQNLSILSVQSRTITPDVTRPFIIRTNGFDHEDVAAWGDFLHLVTSASFEVRYAPLSYPTEGESVGAAMVDLNGHEAGNGGHQGRPTARGGLLSSERCLDLPELGLVDTLARTRLRAKRNAQ